VSSDSIQTRAGDILRRLREQKPLVHQITNFVVMNDTANVTLQVGALPVMAHAPEEMEEMVSLAGALVLNTGTLERPWIDAMITAGKHARLRGIPVVLDPVGAGATSYRTDTDLLIIRDVGPDIVRGNPGEIAASSARVGKCAEWRVSERWMIRWPWRNSRPTLGELPWR